MLFPGDEERAPCTRVEIVRPDRGESTWPELLVLGYAGPGSAGSLPLIEDGPRLPLFGEHSRGLFTRPQLRGHRILVEGDDVTTGADWSSSLRCDSFDAAGTTLSIDASDPAVGLAMRAEFESVVGGALRVRYTVTNSSPGTYVVDGLEVAVPLADHLVEVLDFTGRHEHERSPQRHRLTDGLWLRESRGGRPGLESASLIAVGSPGFSTTSGDVVAVHVAWSGNGVLRLERDNAVGTSLGGGELLLPGEVALAEGDSYATPWVFFASSDAGLDGVAAMLHEYERSLDAHPSQQPVTLNVWEAVFFDHDLAWLKRIADRAARVGVERFVLDDGWFPARRHDRAGLGDWEVDRSVYPDGLAPLVDYVNGLGMSFGLWFEPEMINPDSDLYRAHPDWILSAGGRVPLEHRNQQVLDLTNPAVTDYLFDRMDALLSEYAVEYVKWDHNRELLEAGSGQRGGAPTAHAQTVAFYALLDRLRAAHPTVAWESCASGGGRIDLGVIERVQRFWASDMTDALARQKIQRWTTQLVAPEYVGAHVSAPTSHTTGRTLSLDFRAATALFGSFGIEWDLTTASDDDLDGLAGWVDRYKALRGLLHSGRVSRPESSDPAVQLHGVVAHDASEALIAHVQLDESDHSRGVAVRVPGLEPDALYDLRWEGPVQPAAVSRSARLLESGPTGGRPVTGTALATRGFWMPRRWPETVTLVRITRP